MRDRAKENKVLGEWKREGRGFYKEQGWCLGEVETVKEGEELRVKEMVAKERRWQEKERRDKIDGTNLI